MTVGANGQTEKKTKQFEIRFHFASGIVMNSFKRENMKCAQSLLSLEKKAMIIWADC